jgi:hypothetical protein
MGQVEMNGRVYLLQTVRGKSYTVNVTYDRDIIDTTKLLSDFTYGGNFNNPGEGGQWLQLPDNVKNKNWPEAAYAMPMVWQKNFTFDYFNFYNYNTNQYLSIANAKVPMFYAGWVLEKVLQEVGIKFSGVFYEDAELRKLIIFNTFFYTFLGSSYPPLDPKNHMPKVTLKELLASLRVRFGLGIDLNLRTNEMYMYSVRNMLLNVKELDITKHISGEAAMDIRPAEKVSSFEQAFDSADELSRYIKTGDETIKGSVPDLFTLFYGLGGVEVGDVYLVENLDYYYVFSGGGTWAKYMYRYFDYNRTAESKVKDNSSSVITSLKTDLAYGGNLKTPECEYNIPAFEGKTLNIGLRYLLYHGLHDVVPAGRTYPYASMDNKNGAGAVIGNLELRDDGEYGQYNRYKQYRERLRGAVRYPTVYVRKEAAGMLQGLNPDVLVRIESNLFAWREKTRTYDMHGLRSCELKLAKV